MRDPGRELSDRRHARDVRKLRLRLLHCLFGALGRGDVHHGSDEREFSRFVAQWMRHDMEMFHGAVRHHDSVLEITLSSVMK